MCDSYIYYICWHVNALNFNLYYYCKCIMLLINSDDIVQLPLVIYSYVVIR